MAATYMPARNSLAELKLKPGSIITADQLSSYITALANQANALDTHMARIWKVIGGELPANLTQVGMPYDFKSNVLSLESLALALASVQKSINHYRHELNDPIAQFDLPESFSYDAQKDALIVFENSVLLTEDVDYKVVTYTAIQNGAGVNRYRILLIGKLIEKEDHFDIIRIYNNFDEKLIVDNFSTKDSFEILKDKHNSLVETLYTKGLITDSEMLDFKY